MACWRDVGRIQEPVAARAHRGAQSPWRPNPAGVLAARHGRSEPGADAALTGAGVGEEPGLTAGPELAAGLLRSAPSPERRVQREQLVIRRSDGSRELRQRRSTRHGVDAMPLRLDPQDGVAGAIAPDLRPLRRDVVEVSLGLDVEEVRRRASRRALDDELHGFEVVVVTDVGDAERRNPVARVEEDVGQVGVRSRQHGGAVHRGFELAPRARQVSPVVRALPVAVEVDGERCVRFRRARTLLLREDGRERREQARGFARRGRVAVREGERATQLGEQRYVLGVAGERDQRAAGQHREGRERSSQAAEPAKEFS